MGKRQIILKADKIAGNTSLVGEEVNVVMADAHVWHGYINEVTGSELKLRDARFKVHTLKIPDIDKLFLDRVTDY
ncbi:MAG: hypothetical protein HGB19_03795 [Chlorobiales bacterium]|jgi:hypothetical protein|nr:hypothetical protein [Chlorobiales bacterium]